MKNQALFSSKDKSKKLKCRLLQVLFSALRVNVSFIQLFSILLQFCTVFFLFKFSEKKNNNRTWYIQSRRAPHCPIVCQYIYILRENLAIY